MQRRVALITGAAQGIGRSIARRLASDGGYHLALNDLPAKEEKLHELAEEVGGTVQVGDVSKERDVRRMIDETVKKLGGLDVMVANAGVGVVKPLSQTTETDWDYVFSVHGRGVFLCYKHAAEQMIKQGRGGRIIGASSAAGKRAMEYGKHGITVNAYAPGMIKTEMGWFRFFNTQCTVLDWFKVTSLPPAKFEAAFQTYVSRTALQRPGEMTEIASLVAYLASKEAGYITGQTISIDGGGNFD
uniref:Putative short chain oxidoreductase n=1 Tax=Moniliophthora roreri TaxID=221103 RepID=A0A0W0G2X7_MONRR